MTVSCNLITRDFLVSTRWNYAWSKLVTDRFSKNYWLIEIRSTILTLNLTIAVKLVSSSINSQLDSKLKSMILKPPTLLLQHVKSSSGLVCSPKNRHQLVCRTSLSTPYNVGLFRLPVQRSGTHYLMNSLIRNLAWGFDSSKQFLKTILFSLHMCELWINSITVDVSFSVSVTAGELSSGQRVVDGSVI